MIHVGDCLQIMPTMAENSFDSIVTDPPYGLGFMGKTWDHAVPGIEFWKAALRVAKPGAHLLAFGGTRTFHRLICAIEDAGWEFRDTIMWVYGSGTPKGTNKNKIPSDWEGWNTALKPGWEPIIVARKPLIGTLAENLHAFGVGAMNIDACRVALDGDYKSKPNGRPSQTRLGDKYDPALANQPDTLGRWPANIVHDGSEEVLMAFPNAPGQKACASTNADQCKTKNAYNPTRRGRGDEPSAVSDNKGNVGFKMKPGVRRIDTGSAARFFYCAKASAEDRHDGTERKVARGHNVTLRQIENNIRDGTATGNTHPTVKPTKLMRWCCRLVTPAGGTVLDPFTGSGSTGRGAIAEGFNFVGIEMDAHSADMAEKRIRVVQPGLALGVPVWS